jgi:hypothetical protein
MWPKIASALSTPTKNTSWVQLAAATIFVITVALAWRQVTFFIMREI